MGEFILINVKNKYHIARLIGESGVKKLVKSARRRRYIDSKQGTIHEPRQRLVTNNNSRSVEIVARAGTLTKKSCLLFEIAVSFYQEPCILCHRCLPRELGGENEVVGNLGPNMLEGPTHHTWMLSSSHNDIRLVVHYHLIRPPDQTVSRIEVKDCRARPLTST